MSGFLDTLFGTAPSSDVQQLPTMTKGQRALLDQLVNYFKGQGGSLAGFDPFTGTAGAPANDLQGMSLAALEQMSMNLTGPNSTQNMADQTLQSFLRGDQTGTSNFNEFFKTNIQDPAVEAFNKDVLPGISRSYGGSNFFSTDRQKAEQQATKDLTTSLTQSRASGQLQERNTNIQTLLAAIGLAPQLAGGYANAGATLLGGSLSARSAEQASLDAELKRWIAEQTLKGTSFEQMLSVLHSSPFENVVTTSGGTTGLLNSFLGGLGQGAGTVLGGKIP